MVVSVDCLTALLRDIESIVPLGLQLGFENGTLQAIQSYYNQDEKSLMLSHMINMWLLHSPENMIQQLRDALNHLKKNEISQQLTLLSSLGKNYHQLLYRHFAIKSCRKLQSMHANTLGVSKLSVRKDMYIIILV